MPKNNLFYKFIKQMSKPVLRFKKREKTVDSSQNTKEEVNIGTANLYNSSREKIFKADELSSFDEHYVCGLKDEDSIIKYVNKYFVVVTGGTKIMFCELSFKNEKIDKVIQRNKKETRIRMDDCNVEIRIEKGDTIRKKSVNVFDIWCKNPERRKVERIDFVPYTIHAPRIDDNKVLNIFGGFKARIRDDRYKLDYSGIYPILKHIKEVWCSGDEYIYDYVIGWLAQLFQRPDLKPGVCLVLKSERQGAGKSMIVNFLQDYVMGNEYCRIVSNLDRVFERFNSMSEMSLLTCCEEVGNKGGMYKMSDQFKELITGSKKTVEKKFLDAVQIRDYQRYILFSNNDWIARVEAGERRYFCHEVSDKYVGNNKYFEDLVGSCFNDECGELLLNYLLMIDLEKVNLRNIPMTKWRRDLMMRNCDDILKSLIDFLRDNEEDKSTSFHVTEIYKYYKGDEKSIKTYNTELKKYLSGIELKRDIRKNGVKRVAYVGTSIGDMCDKVRKYLRDPGFSFEKEDDMFGDGDDLLLESDDEI